MWQSMLRIFLCEGGQNFYPDGKQVQARRKGLSRAFGQPSHLTGKKPAVQEALEVHLPLVSTSVYVKDCLSTFPGAEDSTRTESAVSSSFLLLVVMASNLIAMAST